MLHRFLFFLLGCLILVVVCYVMGLILGMLGLPPEIYSVTRLILGLIGLVVLVVMAIRIFSSADDSWFKW